MPKSRLSYTIGLCFPLVKQVRLELTTLRRSPTWSSWQQLHLSHSWEISQLISGKPDTPSNSSRDFRWGRVIYHSLGMRLTQTYLASPVPLVQRVIQVSPPQPSSPAKGSQ